MKQNPVSFQLKLNPEDFLPATEEEKQSQIIMRESVSFWKDGMRRLVRNKVAMVSLVVIIVVMIFSFIVPGFYPYSYKEQAKGANNLAPMEYSEEEQARIDAGEKVFPHIFGTDNLGRDYAIRVMMGSRISLLVGLIATGIIFIIGSAYGSIAAFFGGKVDLIMMRIVDILSGIPSLIYLILIMMFLGNTMSSILLAMCLTFWITTARMVRGQILQIKEQDYVQAAKALGADTGRIIMKHLLPNTLGIIMVDITMSVPGFIFSEAFLSYIGLGVKPPETSWGALASAGQQQLMFYPYQLFFPCLLIVLTILSFHLIGDGLSDALDPKLRQ